MPETFDATVSARMRRTWAAKLGAQVMKFGARIVGVTRPEYRIDHGPWTRSGSIKIDINLYLEVAGK